MTFTTDHEFNSSHKMGEASISLDKALIRLGEPSDTDVDGKCEYQWDGQFTASDGTTMRASAWDWKGGLRAGCGVSIWVSNPAYLIDFKKFIQA
jgi:hypothetical protein